MTNIQAMNIIKNKIPAVQDKNLATALNVAIKAIQKVESAKGESAADKRDIVSLFRRRYALKAKEITGNDAKLPWTGKEAKLLEIDLATHGKETLVKYIEIFFSDKEPTVADFTRYKNKAGYSFSVFHGMIGKLALSKVKPAAVCPVCGYRIGHAPDCRILIEQRERKEKEAEEINKLREQNKDYSFIAEFGKIIRKGEHNYG